MTQIRATKASLHYGSGAYPVEEDNLPEIDLDDAIAVVLKHMSRLSGGFTLDAPDLVTFEMLGNGYAVRFER